MKMCEQIFKKDSAPIQFKFFDLQKTKKRPINAPAITVRLLNIIFYFNFFCFAITASGLYIVKNEASIDSCLTELKIDPVLI